MSQEEKEFREQVSAEAPDDVATLYSWANLHGAKYRDFSASRREHRAHMRAAQQAEAARAAAEVAARAPFEPIAAEAVVAAVPFVAKETPSVVYVREYGDPPAHPAPFVPADPFGAADRAFSSSSSQVRPAWLYGDSASTPVVPAYAATVEEPARERTAERVAERVTERKVEPVGVRPSAGWYALQGAFVPSAGEHEPPHRTVRDGQVPVTAVFSLAGGVGKTSLVATLARALSSSGDAALLVDAAPFGLLPWYFGSREARPGVVRTFSPPPGTQDSAIQLLTLDTAIHRGEGDHESAADSIARSSESAQRVLVDASLANTALAKKILHLATTVVVPIVPEMSSVISLAQVEEFFRANGSAEGHVRPYYVLSQYDAALPLHQDVREVLTQQLGDRLAPVAVRRSAAVSEALAEGMTVVDYAPNSPVTEDYLNLAEWLKTVAPSASSSRGTRWSER